MNKLTTLAMAVTLGTTLGVAQAQEKFEKVRVYFEQNVQDKDVEVKFEATGGNAGLASMKVTAPDGRTVIDFRATDSKLGMRRFVLETPEPKNDGQLQKDFPAGIYKFTGTLVGGAALQGQASLSHALPAPASLIRPRPDEQNVPLKGLKASWTAGRNLDAVVVLVVQEKTGQEIKVRLAGNATSFAVPEGFLQAGQNYKIEVGTMSKEGNASYIESSFTTKGVKHEISQR